MRPIPDRLTPLECWPVHMTRQDKTCTALPRHETVQMFAERKLTS